MTRVLITTSLFTTSLFTSSLFTTSLFTTTAGNPEEKVRKQSKKQSDNLKDASEA